ncbi:MAG: hypothetical protein PHH08_01140 [Candidatus ainarchaeum sp.]|nr:hypothetical protein [Candidatus ainarchaeum sp.]
MKKTLLLTAVIALIAVLFPLASAADLNSPDSGAVFLSRNAAKAKIAVSSALESLDRMQKAGLPTARVSDTIEIANQLFESEKLKEKLGNNADYSNAIQKAKEASKSGDSAFEVFDELTMLQEYIAGLPAEVDKEEVTRMALDANKSFQEERFEEAKEKIDAVYAKIDDMQSISFRTTAMYTAATANIWTLIVAFQAQLAVLIGTPSLIWVIFRKKIRGWRIKKKMERLELQKEVVSNMLKQAQQSYFIDAKIPENIYAIRVETFSKMTRDITRKIAILLEENSRNNGNLTARIAGLFGRKNALTYSGYASRERQREHAGTNAKKWAYKEKQK